MKSVLQSALMSSARQQHLVILGNLVLHYKCSYHSKIFMLFTSDILTELVLKVLSIIPFFSFSWLGPLSMYELNSDF